MIKIHKSQKCEATKGGMDTLWRTCPGRSSDPEGVTDIRVMKKIAAQDTKSEDGVSIEELNSLLTPST